MADGSICGGLECPTPSVCVLDPATRSVRCERVLSEFVELLGLRYPPFALIPRCPAKLRREQTELVLVCPLWLSQALFPLLLRIHYPLSNDELTATAAVGSLVLNPTLNEIYGCNGATMKLDRQTFWKTDGFEILILIQQHSSFISLLTGNARERERCCWPNGKLSEEESGSQKNARQAAKKKKSPHFFSLPILIVEHLGPAVNNKGNYEMYKRGIKRMVGL